MRKAMLANESAVCVRAAIRRDIPGIVAVCRNSVSEMELVGFGVLSPESPYKDVESLSAAWLDPNRVGSEELFIALMDNCIVGVVTIEERPSELEIVDIDVARDCQRKGIGTRLVGFVEDRARALQKSAVTLGTSRNAEGMPWISLSFWQALGYVITHEEENAWTRSIGPGTREIRMRKDL